MDDPSSIYYQRAVELRAKYIRYLVWKLNKKLRRIFNGSFIRSRFSGTNRVSG